MGGGLMQLVAYGAQDVYLTGNPQITYFKVVYRRHTNFSIECIEQPVDSSKFGGRQTVQVLRNGDLATRMYLRMVLPSITGDELPTYNQGYTAGYGTKIAWVRRVGHAMINNIELTIGGSQIDKHWGTWMDVWYELTHTNEQEKGYNTMIGDVSELINLKGAVTGTAAEVILPEYTLYVPLQFWFCRNTGLALPLIALQYHEVRLNIELASVSKLIVWSGPLAPVTTNIVLGSCGLMVDYIYLDSEERRRFAQVGHEYLIEQLQFGGSETLVSSNSSGSVNVKHKLEFNHPTKEIVWAPVLGAWTDGNKFLTYTGFDDTRSWELATDAAATNIAEGMFVLGAPNNATALGWVNVTGVPAVAGGATTIISFVGTTVVAIPDLVITVVVKNSSANASAANPLWVNPNVLKTSTNAYLSNNIKSVVVTVTVGVAANTFVSVVDGAFADSNVTNTSTLLPVGSVQVLSHTLNLTDASLPVGTADLVDNRANTAVDSPAVAPRDVNALLPNNYGLRLDGAGNLVNSAKIQLNGHDRFYLQQGSYFNSVQPAQHHTRTPADGINVYSFALHPEQHQPSGSANLSRIDTTILAVTYQDSLRAASGVAKMSVFINTNVYIYAFSYNVLRIMSGMGGLAYAN
jgi:hypothetical protein